MKWIAAIIGVLALAGVAVLSGGVTVNTLDYITVNVGAPIITTVGTAREDEEEVQQ